MRYLVFLICLFGCDPGSTAPPIGTGGAGGQGPESDFVKCCGTEDNPCVCPRGWVYSCAYEFKGTELLCACRIGEP